MVWNRWFVVIVVLVLISACAAIAQEFQPQPLPQSLPNDTEKDTVVSKNPTGAMLRSIFVPGWGQFYNGKWFKGLVFAGVEVGLMSNALVLNKWANEATSDEEYYFYIDNRNLSFWLLGATILYSMADAYVDAHLFGFDESPELAFYIRQESEPLVCMKSSILTLRLSFAL